MKLSQKLLVLTLAAGGLLAQTASALITIDTVPVGNAGNAADPATGLGSVSYDYGIGKYEVTLNQYTAFLNAVGATDTYGLWNSQMGSNPNIMGISRSGASGSYAYSVIGSGNRPVTFVSWFDSARFVNWLHNGQPTGAQNAATTEQGAYTLNGALSGIITRNTGWTYGLPSQNEWYKAAFHQPVAQGGDVDNYWLYPTASNAMPNSRNGSGSDANSANYFRDDGIANGFNGGYAVNNSITPPSGNALTDVGSFSLADSFYGTFDQGGSVWEWNDAIDVGFRGMRGGAWNAIEPTLRAVSGGNVFDPAGEDVKAGFRIAIVPEPGVIGLMALGTALLAWQRKRAL
ncbi:MAG: SUMF1/EgtB/PvdO family nonheme iron enzyme [Verrucomicrobia bacterium]|nr:SUMF1/EgtB/PvdO family nonheme iron enzyme [Verrucomicrobiota bacterium]